MKITFIFLPTRCEINWTNLDAQDKVMESIPPLSLTYAAAVAERAGHKVSIIDAVAERLNLDKIVSRINALSPDILGFTVTTYGFAQNLNNIRLIKERVKIPVIVGGWHLSLYPAETIAHPEFDYAVVGEADDTLPELLKTLEWGGDLKGVKGIAYRRNGDTIVNAPREVRDTIDETLFPARHLLKNNQYFNVFTQRKNFTGMLSSRGCPFRCIFCDLKTKKYRLRSPENFVDEMEVCYKEFGIRSMDIHDTIFTINKKRASTMCEEMMRRKLDIDWTARARSDTVDKDMLKMMSRAGCKVVMFGIESGDPEILRILRKDIKLDRVREVVKWTKHYGMKALGFFILGSPGETTQSIRRTLNFACELPLDYVQFTKMTPFPNTELYELYKKEYGGDYWRDFTLDPSKEKELPLVGTDLSQKDALRYLKKAYIRFYFRPSYIIRALSRVGSFFELKNSAIAAYHILFTNHYLRLTDTQAED
ncbi:MAG TPA: B12-binding domain-containing radical SAM protein [Candidatus Hypogeohydataceae bacterium YC38]|nr:radical SAM protein [Candidatus Brocadiales bacterium]